MTTRKLHIGGWETKQGWEILDANSGVNVDHEMNATDLSAFEDATFSEVYASHVVEHLDYKKEVLATLKEWRRVIAPGGKIYISVPDLKILASLFIDQSLSSIDQFKVMRMMYGGHVDEHDYHKAGFSDKILSEFLIGAGFINPTKVKKFGIFKDTSEMEFNGTAVSLNMIAENPKEEEPEAPSLASIGRNDPCPCNSGKKYKKCCGLK